MDKILRPNWVEISLEKFIHNLNKLKKILKNKKLMLVVKANAYGHGMTTISRFAEEKKLCSFLGVSAIEEGIELREAGVKLPIIILGSIYPFSNFKYFFEYKLTPTISSIDAMDEIIKYSRQKNSKINVHLKLETGMNRIGARENSLKRMIEKAVNSKSVNIEGIYSHLSSADSDKNYTLWQIENYKNMIKGIKGINFIRHIANSSATINFPSSHMDMARCGIAAYGNINGFEQILQWKTKIVFLKYVKKGSFISYSKSYKTKRHSKIATIPLGYGDGYLRALSNKAEVLVNGKRAKLIGTVTMDMSMIDVTEINVNIGDTVIISGRSGDESITIKELALKANTIPYEITTLITKRVPRIYV
ncbi:MAG: alanine racemase [Elusimicrobiota bacterium]